MSCASRSVLAPPVFAFSFSRSGDLFGHSHVTSTDGHRHVTIVQKIIVMSHVHTVGVHT